ncbi:unnamed protein product [Phytomonas sp. EM1]|nr:unnamed protein product [Phytomonas sp. EM1]|eukprot:CCW63136.1 unnamed protein product [Phytomonas sp. isolate EM1]
MSAKITHKESLPGQNYIKRRRTEPALILATEKDQPKQHNGPLSNSGSADPPPSSAVDPVGTSKMVRSEEDRTKCQTSASPSTSEAESSSSDDDDEVIERERERLAQLHRKNAAPGDGSGETGPDSAASGGTHTKIGSYNYDVLFRRPEWQNKPSEKPADKWKSVINNKQESESFRQFMKKHFK